MRFFTKIPDLSPLTQLDKRYQAARVKYFRRAMERSVESVGGAAMNGIPSVSGSTRDTITSEVFGTNSMVGIVSSSARDPNVGPYVLNFGRKAGSKSPSGDSLVNWIRSRGIGLAGQSLEETAFLIARSIKKKGTKGLHFMIKALSAKTGEINQNFGDAVNSIVEELDHGH